MNRALLRPLLLCLFLTASWSPAVAVMLQPGDLVVIDTSAKTLVRLDPATGEREQFAGWKHDTGKHLSFPWGIALHPDGRILLGDMNARAIFAIDPHTEKKSLISGGRNGKGMNLAGVRGIALDGAGGLYASVSRRTGKNVNHLMFHVDLATGDRRPISASDIGSGPELLFPADIAVESDGNLLVNMRAAKALYRIDPATGDRSELSSAAVGDGPALGSPFGITLLRNGDAVITDRTESQIVYIDTKSGDRRIIASAEVGTGPEVKAPFGVVQAHDGNLYVSDLGTWSVYHLNLADGVRTVIASPSVGSGPPIEMPRNLALVPGFATETPFTLRTPLAIVGLVAAGAGLLFVLARRRNRQPPTRDGSEP